ncbi:MULTISPECIES: ketosteroid isomerase family protein [unclassified Mycobacterium]|uniref:nuclear transport factor 2 family protein n=1 Tax=unclassified Mycobacterium TaxID=2642494 RepID=UPI0007FEBABA|nr:MULTISPECIES: ketosteroid isomerase family protein [unclassified Mycobacterium]OBG58695.1 transporter [Mycobacterium sp. E735]OBG64891.1 transporter [Mycobacterium sp. E188]OBH43477.1 transporter [Mycobacterium sp. E183]
MGVAPERERLLAAVERSPRAAAAHDREGWVGLFADDGRVEDPVGSRPHVGRERIGRFYDTFIGPRDITFHRDLDIVFGTAVLRDLELEVAMGSGVTMYIPAFLRYDLLEVNGDWRIGELRAYWELPAMMRQFLRTGPRAVPPGLQLSRGLLNNQRLSGAVGFIAAFRRVGARHKQSVRAFLDAATAGDRDAAARALTPSTAITLGDDEVLDLAGLVEQLDGAGGTKMIGAGSTVVVSLTSTRGRAIIFADMTWRPNAINRIRYFPA